jgi:hypothetical protein
VPCEIVDEIWHSHILDTRAYDRDCRSIVGTFLHHYPYFGMGATPTPAALEAAYNETLARYRAALGEPPTSTCVAADGRARCRGCRPGKCR